jgi:integrase
MIHVRYRYVIEDRDRHGNVRRYFWRRPGPKVRLHEEPGSEAFARRYRELLDGTAAATPSADALGRAEPGTLRWLVQRYVASSAMRSLGASTRQVRRLILEHCCREPIAPDRPETFGQFPLARLDGRALAVLRDRKADLPGAATGRVKALRPMFKWAVAEQMMTHNPARDLTRARAAGKASVAWSDDDIAAFEARHPVGTRARLALALLIYTGMRRSDVVQIGRQHVRDGWISKPQWKGRARHPHRIEVPMLAPLAEIIARSPVGDMTYLVTDFGRPFTIAGFGNWFRDRCDEAGLAGLSAHGLRKAGATRAAEGGATAHQLMSMFGWRSLAEAELYTRAAERKRLAASGMALLVPTARSGGDERAEKSIEINGPEIDWRALRERKK